MAGGTWTTQNKVRPGVYINFKSEPQAQAAAGERGTVTMALPLSWGEPRKIIQIEVGDNLKEALGYDITAPQLLLVRETLKRAKTLLLYRLNEGVKAAATAGNLTATAKYGGSRGNDIQIVVQANIDDNAKFDVKTLVDHQEVDVQTVSAIAELADNAWVSFSGSGALTATAGLALAGGADGTVTNQDHADYLSAIEVYEFQTMALPSAESALKSVYAAFVRRLREEEGRKIQCVLENYPIADYEGIISVKNGVVLADGTVVDSVKATAWVAAATAGAQVNQSLTYQAYDDAVDVDKRYTNAQIEAALRSGEFVFVPNNGRAIVEQDINTLTGFSPDKGKPFAKNRVIRVLDGLANDFKRIFETSYIGKIDNSADGRSLFRNECVKQAEAYQNMNAIQGFNSQTDVVVMAGDSVDSLFVEAYIQPVDAIEKIYMKVQVK